MTLHDNMSTPGMSTSHTSTSRTSTSDGSEIVRGSTSPDSPGHLPGMRGDSPLDGEYFHAEYRIRTGDVAPSMRLRLDAVARYLQDIANDNLDASGVADADPFWIVRRTVIDVHSPISWPGSVHLQRWCGGVSTRWANMRVRMTAHHDTNPFNPDPRPAGLIETEAFWINVNDKGMPSRISDAGFTLLAKSTDEHRLRWSPMNTTPMPESGDDRPHTLRATDFDPFDHMNNAAYWQIAEDEVTGRPHLLDRPFRAVIEYLRPIPQGSSVTVRRDHSDDRVAMWMLLDGQVAATMALSPLPVE